MPDLPGRRGKTSNGYFPLVCHLARAAYCCHPSSSSRWLAVVPMPGVAVFCALGVLHGVGSAGDPYVGPETAAVDHMGDAPVS